MSGKSVFKTMFSKDFKAVVFAIRKKILSSGLTLPAAAKLGGISHRTLYRWLQGSGGRYPVAKKFLIKLEGKPAGYNMPAVRVSKKLNIKTGGKK